MTEYPQASPCAGVQFYQWDGREPSMMVALSQRTALVGGKLGISNGGFAEIGTFLNTEIGTCKPMTVEAYREMGEEFFGANWQEPLSRVIPFPNFDAHAQPLQSYLVRTADANRVHAPTYYAYPLNMAERMALSALPETPERTGQLRWLTLSWAPETNRRVFDTFVRMKDNGTVLGGNILHWPHEEQGVFCQLAWLANTRRLWHQRV